MDTFAPISALAGGVLIGAAASLLLWLNGRVAGISSIAGGLVTAGRGFAGSSRLGDWYLFPRWCLEPGCKKSVDSER